MGQGYHGSLDSQRPRRRIGGMKWETPAFVEINMSAEIGGYQSDFSDRDPWGPVAPRGESGPSAQDAGTQARSEDPR